MRLTSRVLLLITLSFLTSCKPVPRSEPDLSWVEPIHFHQATITYLEGLHNAPPELYDDLGKIWLHNKKCLDILGKK